MQHIILNIPPFRVYSPLAPINHVTTCTLADPLLALSFFSSPENARALGRAIDDGGGGGGGITISSTSTVILAAPPSLSLLFSPKLSI